MRMDTTDPQQWAFEFEMAITNRSIPVVYAVTTNWWNEFRTWLMLMKEGIQLEFQQGEGIMGSSNKLDNSTLIKEGDYNERTVLHQQMKDLQKDSIKIVQDYFMVSPQQFHINQDYSLISSEAYQMIIRLIGGGPHIRLFLQDSQGDPSQSDIPNIITSDMEGRECIGQGKIISLDTLQLGVIMNHNQNSTLEVGYYPLQLTLQELANSFPINTILFSAIAVDLSHCQYDQDPENIKSNNNPQTADQSQDLLKKTIGELGIAHGSIVVFTLNQINNEDDYSMEVEQGSSSHNEILCERQSKKYRKRDQYLEEQDNHQGNKFLRLQSSENESTKWQKNNNNESTTKTSGKTDYTSAKEILQQQLNMKIQQCMNSQTITNNQINFENETGEGEQLFGQQTNILTDPLDIDIEAPNNNHQNSDNLAQHEDPPKRGNRRGNIIFRKKPDNSNASTEENGESIPDTEDLNYSRNLGSHQQLAGQQKGFIGQITKEEIQEIRIQVEQSQLGRMRLEILSSKVVIGKLENMEKELGQQINEMKQLIVKMEQGSSSCNANNKAEENIGKTLIGDRDQEGEEEEEEGGDRKEDDFSERTSSTSTQPDNGKCFKNKHGKQNLIGTNQILQTSNLLDQSNMTDADEQPT